MRSARFSLGLDFGTGSVRALIVDTASGEGVASSAFDYPSGERGVLLDSGDRNVARQSPEDHLAGLAATVQQALRDADRHDGFAPEHIVGIGVDTTGSTPLPVDEHMRPLTMCEPFRGALAAQAWLWKDHSAHEEAARITATAKRMRPAYLTKCGGTYSSEWFWSKALRCAEQSPKVFEAAAGWLELCDFVPAWLCGIQRPEDVRRSICAAAHKALYHPEWGGLPDEEFLTELHPDLVRMRRSFRAPAQASNLMAGRLCAEQAALLGLREGTPVATGALDAHLGAIGSGVGTGTLVKILGTSTCDCMVAPLELDLPDVPGLCGIAPESILPGMHGIEAGQSAVGDIFQWFVDRSTPGHYGTGAYAHSALAEAADRLAPGQSGLLALDWHNGNRSVLADSRLRGMILGLDLQTDASAQYRAWIEATAFGARKILEQLAAHGVPVDRVVTCGGIAGKSPLLMQIYADVCGVELATARSDQACALGAAIFGAVVGGAHADVVSAQASMVATPTTSYRPRKAAGEVYDRLYALYRRLHDAFGIQGTQDDLADVMKELLQIQEQAQGR